MRIGVLGGTGPAGLALAARLADAGFETVVGSRSPERALAAVAALAQRWPQRRLPVTAADNARAADADIVVVATPWDGAVEVVSTFERALSGKVIVCMANAVRRAGREFGALVLPRGSVAAEVQAALPEARVCAAFNHVPARELGDLDRPVTGDVLLCSDHPTARATTADIVARVPHMRPLDAGGLALAQPVESFTAVLLQLNARYRARVSMQLTGLDHVDRGAPEPS